MKDITIGNIDKLEITFRLKKRKWDLGYDFGKNVNHRCYCPVGWALNIYLPIGIIFISYYNGEIPCPCDKIINDEKKINIYYEKQL